MSFNYLSKSFSRDAVTILVGSIIFAVGLDCFEIPNGLAAGGASGLATIVAELCRRNGLPVPPVGMQVLTLNAVLMLAVFREGGLRYAARSGIGMVASALATDLLAGSLPVLGNGDLLLCSVWGGVTCGFGLGLIFRSGGNTGGTDIVAQLVSKRTGIPLGTASLAADMSVVALSVPVFGIENALYASVAMYLGTRVLDTVLDGFNTNRIAYVISDLHEPIKQAILSELGRGCTELLARGGYTGVNRPMLFVVLTRTEMAHLRRMVQEIDPRATVVVGKIHEAVYNDFT